MIFDSNEQSNLVADEPSAAALREMRGRLDNWMSRTNDPLSKGLVPAPPGAKVNPVDGISPNEPVVDAR